MAILLDSRYRGTFFPARGGRWSATDRRWLDAQDEA